MQCNVFRLGKVYNRLAEHLNVPAGGVEPELFTERILSSLSLPTAPELTQAAAETRNRELLSKVKVHVSSLLSLAKKDWLAVGRIPSAICAAAVLLSLRAHGVDYPMDDISASLHIASR